MPFTQLSPRRQRGFSLVEMSVVLIVIGLIIGTVSIGRNVYQAAQMQRVASDFVQGWALTYDAYVAGTGTVPGDLPAAPSGRVNNSGTALCGLALRTAVQATGIVLPAGRAEGSEDLYVYQDSNGNPQQLAVCFQSVQWAEPGAVPGTYVARNRNVLSLIGVTPALANSLDAYFDSRIDARFGRLREVAQAALTTTVPAPWSATERDGINGGVGSALDEDQMPALNAYLLMSR